jgi:hypothetical protein
MCARKVAKYWLENLRLFLQIDLILSKFVEERVTQDSAHIHVYWFGEWHAGTDLPLLLLRHQTQRRCELLPKSVLGQQWSEELASSLEKVAVPHFQFLQGEGRMSER